MNTYQKFLASIAQADLNVMIIFGIVTFALLAWYSIKFLPRNWQNITRIIAWVYALSALALTVVYGISKDR